MLRRILWLSHDPRSTTSFARQTNMICQALAKKNYDIHVLGAGKKDQPEIYNGYYLYPYPKELGIKKTTHAGSAELLAEYLELLQPDILITLENIARYEYIPAVLNKFKNKPYWLHWGPSETNKIFTENIELENQPDLFLVLTNDNLKVKKTYLKNVIKLGHPIDPAFHSIPKQESSKTREKLGFKSTDLVCGCLAANNLRKQLPVLIKSFSELSLKQKNIKLLLVTTSFNPTDPESTDLEACLNKLRETDNIKIIYTDKREVPLSEEELNSCFYNIIDIFVSATAGEGFCLPVGEALACGKPAVVTNCPNINELVINNKTGLLVPAAGEVYDLIPRSFTNWQIINTDDLIKKILKLNSQKNLLKKLGKNAALHIKNNFTLEKIIPKMEKLYGKAPALERTTAVPDIAPLKEWLGLEYFKHGWWQEMIDITIDLYSAPIYNLRGLAYRRLGQKEQARIEFKKALEIDPSLELAKTQLKELLV